ncbi:mucin-5AC isoform X2 [Pectinophora gossypiella]|uniref:mucin-5AC isoform X2 n=1 Tax=Pectinophora gossypiella TaxID=13191 RepID=UPI00214E1D6E|nr:mucin-5AC isoform X2 [Pectinophora gossypiella]
MPLPGRLASCETSMATTAVIAMMEQLLTTAKSTTSTKPTTQATPTITARSSTIATTITSTVPSTTASVLSTTEKNITTSAPATTKKLEVITNIEYTLTQKSTMISNSSILSTLPTSINTYNFIPEEATKIKNETYNRTEWPIKTTKLTPTIRPHLATQSSTVINTTELSTIPTTIKPSTAVFTTPIPRITTVPTTVKERTRITVKVETSKKPEPTIKQPTTTKFKPKEIWIKPAQKGESQFVESKVKTNQELPQAKSKVKEVSEVTTPKTIIVSIIPTSVSYITFKKIALTTALAKPQKSSYTTSSHIKGTDKEYTKAMLVQTTSAPVTITISPKISKTSSTINPLLVQNVTKPKSHISYSKGTLRTTLPTNQSTNSMISTLNAANKVLNSSLLTTVSSFPTNASRTTRRQTLSETSINKHNLNVPNKNQTSFTTRKTTEKPVTKQFITVPNNVTKAGARVTEPPIITTPVGKVNTNSKRNLTNSSTKTVTDDPSKDEDTFHILTEPEHITAVMGDKGTDRSTIDLISVISIAGGVMMAVITVAVVIVMLERCKRPRYEDVRKYNDIRMQVMMDNNDIPPPYVRSIFHTPLPDPPTTDKCHYQPISTLDRNLKQFMRPVVVQTISPLMLENFRGILECHYDHLPRRSQDMGSMPTRCSIAPSHDERAELLPTRAHSLTDSDIEAMKCEAKLDVIDNTTSEPLYAEIPCWRPPSARAIEVVNLNGEAVTEL